MINIVNETKFNIPKKVVKNCVAETLKTKHSKAESLSIVFVEPKKIRRLNSQHMGRDSVTDVLSFTSEEDNYLGDIIICPQYIKENFAEFILEICHVVVHGSLHLLGVHHDDELARQKLHKLEYNIISKVTPS